MVAPRNGVFFSSWKRGERLRPETRLRAQARYKEKERWERLSWRKLLLFRMCLCPDGSTLVLCGLVLPLAPLPLRGAGGQAFSHKNIAFHWKTAASYGDRDTVWQG